MSRTSQPATDPSVIAALHQAGRQWRAVVARRENGSLRLLDSREFTLAEAGSIESWLLQQQARRVIVALPASFVVCRTTNLPDAAPDQLQAALSLQAETHLEGVAPAHRRALAVLHPGPGESTRTGLIIAWPERTDTPTVPFEFLSPQYTADVACLAALMNGTRGNDPLLWIDRSHGSIALALTHPQGVVFRASSEQGDDPIEWRSGVLRLVAETAINVGHSDEFTDHLIDSIGDAITPGAESSALLLSDEARTFAAQRLKGAKSDPTWWNRFAIPVGALLATLDQLDPLTRLSDQPPISAPTGAQQLLARLSQWRTAAALLILALVALGIGPLVFSGARLLILHWKVGGDLRAFQERQQEREARLVMYGELSRKTWPMAKLLADIVNSAPPGIIIDSIRLDEVGNEVDIRGQTDSAEIANEFSKRLSASGIFTNVPGPQYSEREQRAGKLQFTLTAAVKNPYRQATYAEDYAEVSLAERMYGDRARPGGRRTAQANPGGGRQPAPIDEDDEEAIDDSGARISQRNIDGGRTGPRGPRPPVNIPTQAREGAQGPEMPAMLTQDEIEALSHSDATSALLKVVNARNNSSGFTPEQQAQIQQQYEWLMARLRAGRGGGS